MEFYGVIRTCCSHICWWFLKYHELKSTEGFMWHFENSWGMKCGITGFLHPATLDVQLNHVDFDPMIQCQETQTDGFNGCLCRSRPFIASIATCGSMAQHSGILGRSIGWIRTSFALEVLRWVEMDCCLTQWLSSFHHCQDESPSKRIGRVNVQVADFVFSFKHFFTMVGRYLGFFDSMSIHSCGHFNRTEVGWSWDWQEAPQSGASRSGQLQGTFSVESSNCSKCSRERLSWHFLFDHFFGQTKSNQSWEGLVTGAGSEWVPFVSCSRASMKILLGSLKKATIPRPRVSFDVWRVLSRMDISKEINEWHTVTLLSGTNGDTIREILYFHLGRQILGLS